MESLYSPCLLKTRQKYYKIHVLWKCNQNNKSNLWYSTLESIVPLQSTSLLSLQKCVSTNVFKLQKLFPLGNHHQYEQENKTRQEFKIQTPQVSNGLFLIVMSYKPKNYVIYLLP